jgi:sentrin-specific protease 7
VGEYRHVLRAGGIGKGKTRRRRSRTLSSSAHPAQSDTVGAKLDVHQASGPRSPNRNRLFNNIDSPDALASEQRPSAVTNAGFVSSRLFPKRDRPYGLAEHSRPQIKRQKPSTVTESIDLSEDELQADFAKYTESKSGKNTISKTPAHLNHRTKTPLRGDIQSTVFKASSRRQTRSDDIPILGAVCGRSIYERGDNSDIVALRREDKDGRRLEAVLENGRIAKEHSWLGIDLDQVLYFGYSEPPSRYGYIMRSTKTDIGPKLFLEFESIKETEEFCELLKTAKIQSRFL